MPNTQPTDKGSMKKEISCDRRFEPSLISKRDICNKCKMPCLSHKLPEKSLLEITKSLNES